MADELDPALLQDFITESGELIEQLDADLVSLESAATDRESADLLNSIFRALHTVKGAAGFLNLGDLTVFAHAAEDAFNHLRERKQTVGAEIIDVLLASADVLRAMIDDLANDRQPASAGQSLLDKLHAIAAAGDQQPGASDTTDTTAAAAQEHDDARSDRIPLNLAAQKQDLLGFMTADLRDTCQQIRQDLDSAQAPSARTDAASQLEELLLQLERTAEFFELDDLSRLLQTAHAGAAVLDKASDADAVELLVRLGAVAHLIEQQADALDQGHVRVWPLDTLTQRLETLANGQPLDSDVVARHGGDIQAVLQLDGVLPADPSTAATESATAADDPQTPAGPAKPARPAARAEQTIRVDVSRLESLLNLVGQMVLAKNRVLSISRKIQSENLCQELTEQVAAAANELDRLTDNLQVGVMRTRLQPISKLVDRYPRVIRDIARMTHKQIELAVTGRDTEVDKSVLELLADPLVHILRNSADHGIETPADRQAAGKPANGTIRLTAEHQGSHVRIEVADDGKGIDRDVIAAKALEYELASEEQIASMSDEQVFQFIFSAGFSTVEKITALSGRGVGMDVVRTNVEKMNGSIRVTSILGQGTEIEILIPLTVAIMPAMVVGVGRHLYCVPLQSVIEIIRPNPDEIHQVDDQPVIQLRDSVLPLLDMHTVFAEAQTDQPPFAMVVAAGSSRAGLLVDRLVGQQDIVIKPIHDSYAGTGPFCGATILEDGDVSLILDVVQLLRHGQESSNAERTLAA